MVGRLEVRARLDQRVIRGDEIAQSLDVARVHGFDGVVETGMRTERPDGFRQPDVVLQLGPAVEAIFARNHQLGIGERQRRGKNGLGRLAPVKFEAWVMRRYARGGRRAAATMLLLELVGLDFQLTDTWTRR
jgi:hypothetical protein